ncbi:MAG: sigma-70 family RNA polymerase sigma factor [Candidatus Firestonebacteria bacterium]
MGDEDIDIVLVNQLKGGKTTAFNQIVLKYKDKVFNTAYRFLGNYQDANDLTQECFVSVHNGIKNFRGESSLSTWIYRIAVNACKNKLKSLERRKDFKTLSLKEKILDIKDNNSPVELFERKELENKVQNAIDSLPEDWKETVILRDIEGLTYEEIAKILGCEVGTIKSRIHRARMSLRDKLKEVVNEVS